MGIEIPMPTHGVPIPVLFPDWDSIYSANAYTAAISNMVGFTSWTMEPDGTVQVKAHGYRPRIKINLIYSPRKL